MWEYVGIILGVILIFSLYAIYDYKKMEKEMS